MKRRSFIKTAAVGTAAFAVAPSAMAEPKAKTGTRTRTGLKESDYAGPKRISSPDGKVNMAFVGIGNRGEEDFDCFIKTGMVNVVGLCDVDMGAPHTKKVIDACPGVPQYKDFRVMFEELKDKIEAVCIATPDFSHFAICIAAMRHGFHVYVEKPLARTFTECELLMAAEKKYGVVTQMGNQGHSAENFYQFKAWKEAGLIKDVTAVTAHMNMSRRWHPWNPAITAYPAAQPVPETMDWDTWLMQSHPRPYHDDYHRGQWRCWYELGMGVLGDWGAHILDTIHEFLDLGLPCEVEPVLLKDHNRFFYPKSSTLKFKFPERGDMHPVEITWYDGLDNIPAVPEGYGVSELDPNIPSVAGGKVQPAKLNPGKEIYTKSGLIFKGGSHASTLSLIPGPEADKWEGKLPEYPEPASDHYENFLLAMAGREQAHSRFSVSAPLSQVFCLGVIAQWTQRKILFDRQTKQITNDPIANQLLWGPTPRAGWEEFYKAEI